MSKEINNEAEIGRRIDDLREKGYKEGRAKLVENSARLQTKFLPIESVLSWLDEQISKVRSASDSSKKRNE